MSGHPFDSARPGRRAIGADLRILVHLLRGQPKHGDQRARLQAFYGPQASHYDAFRDRLLHGREALIGDLLTVLEQGTGGIASAAPHAVPNSARHAAPNAPAAAKPKVPPKAPTNADQAAPLDASGRNAPGNAAVAGLADAHVVELGGGTGRNLEFFGPCLETIGQVTLIDLCPALLEQARRKFASYPNVRIIEADATRWQPEQATDAVYFAYSLTMIPDWRAALDNAMAMLKPGGVLGVVDFYVSASKPPGDQIRHHALTRWFWPRWFAHDGVHPNPEHLATLRARLPEHALTESRAPVPYLPGFSVPYYRFIGRRV